LETRLYSLRSSDRLIYFDRFFWIISNDSCQIGGEYKEEKYTSSILEFSWIMAGFSMLILLLQILSQFCNKFYQNTSWKISNKKSRNPRHFEDEKKSFSFRFSFTYNFHQHNNGKMGLNIFLLSLLLYQTTSSKYWC
jgi:hypothetical protein